MTPKNWEEERFIPATRAVSIGGGILYRPIRSWHSGNLAGERLTEQRGDRSGCMVEIDGRRLSPIPYTVTHRIYWNTDEPERFVSAFLSYPNGMGAWDRYFWEANIGDTERYASEEECEAAIRAHLTATPSESKEP